MARGPWTCLRFCAARRGSQCGSFEPLCRPHAMSRDWRGVIHCSVLEIRPQGARVRRWIPQSPPRVMTQPSDRPEAFQAQERPPASRAAQARTTEPAATVWLRPGRGPRRPTGRGSDLGTASREKMANGRQLIDGVAPLTKQTESTCGSGGEKRESLPHERNVVIKHPPAHPQLRPSELLRQNRQR